ncbi:hypothetical protein F1728_25900 [Gimesia benthica]|uniref:RnfC Barrel sandwich hybrid domain-containing protein n=1 Tax=Gimesia benthica TaxID=2608982 RepID=A0A6I6ALD3_9PLAN|nr:hypothetical protein [Gimesia benthica]QGQ25891.1 hypothetical protein F1728_25900 [Gimesia benthica]
MTQAYSPGLQVRRQTLHSSRRILPIPGDVLVKVGEQVTAQQIVAQTFMPGDVTPINVANQISVAPAEVPGCMLFQEGDEVQVGDLLARSKGIFGFFKSETKAKTAGTIESISHVTGQVILRGAPLPIQVRAYQAGIIKEVIPGQGVVIESQVTFLQGILGIGGEAYGKIQFACQIKDQPLTEDLLDESIKGKIVIGGARMTGTAVKRGIELGAAAIVSGGIDDEDLKEILGYDLGVAVTGSEHLGTTLIITEGFGDIAMADRTFNLLKEREGAEAAVNGTTQIRAGVLRPEIVIPLDISMTSDSSAEDVEVTSGLLETGVPVRIIRDPYFGLLGEVGEMPTELRTLESGSQSRVLEVILDSGEKVIVPRANVELIEG